MKHQFHVLVNISDIIFNDLHRISKVLLLVIGREVNQITIQDGLVFYRLFQILELALPVVLVGVHTFPLANHQNVWKIDLILKISSLKMNLSFIDHGWPLAVIMSNREFCNRCVGLADDRYDKVHEDHKQEEGYQDVNEDREQNYFVRLSMLID